MDLTNVYGTDDHHSKRRNYHDFLSLDIHPVGRDGRIDSDPVLPIFPPPLIVPFLPPHSFCNYVYPYSTTDHENDTSLSSSSSTTSSNKAMVITHASHTGGTSTLSSRTATDSTIPTAGQSTKTTPTPTVSSSTGSSSSLSSKTGTSTTNTSVHILPTHLKPSRNTDNNTDNHTAGGSSSSSSTVAPLPSTSITPTANKISVIPTHLTKSRSPLPPPRVPSGSSGSAVRIAYSTVLNNNMMMMKDSSNSTSHIGGGGGGDGKKQTNSASWSPVVPEITKVKSSSVTNYKSNNNNHNNNSNLSKDNISLTLHSSSSSSSSVLHESVPVEKKGGFTSIIIGNDPTALSSISNASSTKFLHGRNVKTKLDSLDTIITPAEREQSPSLNDDMEGIPVFDPDADEQEIRSLGAENGISLLPNQTLAVSESVYREFRRKIPSNRLALSRDSHFGQRDDIWMNEIRRRASILEETPTWIEKEKLIKASLEKGRATINLRGVYHPKPNQVAPKWRCCYYLDYRQEYLGAYTSILEAAVAYDYAVSYMRPHDIGVINGVRHRVGGKVIDINFPGTVSDCRVEPPIDPWPQHVQEAESIMANAAAEQNAAGIMPNTAAAVAAVMHNASSVMDSALVADEIHIIRGKKEKISPDPRPHHDTKSTDGSKKSFGSRAPNMKAIPGRRFVDIIDEYDDDEEEEENNAILIDEANTKIMSGNEIHEHDDRNEGTDDENEEAEEEDEEDVVITENNEPVPSHSSSTTTTRRPKSQNADGRSSKRFRGRPLNRSGTTTGSNNAAVVNSDTPIVIRTIAELLPVPPDYVPLPLVDLNDDTTVDFDEPVEAWLIAEKAIEPLPDTDDYVYAELPLQRTRREPEEPTGGLIGPEHE